jgi:hypothetical protein
MFIDKISTSYPWPVTVFVPNEGKAEKRTLVLEFNRFTVEELRALALGPDKESDEATIGAIQAALMEREDTTAESATALLLKIGTILNDQQRRSPNNEWLFPQIVGGWRGVVEEDGKTERPYSYPALKALLSKYNAWTDVSTAWTDSLKAGRTKNS